MYLGMNTSRASGHRDRRVGSDLPNSQQRHLSDSQPESPPVSASTQVTDEPLIGLRTLSLWLSVSESTVRKWAARGPDANLLPTMIRVNGQIRFRPSDVRTFLKERELR